MTAHYESKEVSLSVRKAINRYMSNNRQWDNDDWIYWTHNWKWNHLILQHLKEIEAEELPGDTP